MTDERSSRPTGGPEDKHIDAHHHSEHQGSCGDCGRYWNALGEAHCASCCEHFTSDSAFDRHLASPTDERCCFLPGEIRDKRGRAAFVLTSRASRPTWMLRDEREHPFSTAVRHSGKRSECANADQVLGQNHRPEAAA